MYDVIRTRVLNLGTMDEPQEVLNSLKWKINCVCPDFSREGRHSLHQLLKAILAPQKAKYHRQSTGLPLTVVGALRTLDFTIFGQR